jgi:hypothetical protein
MKISRASELQFEEGIVSVFEDYPSLCGFTVQDRPGLPDGGSESLLPGLFLTDVGLYPQPGLEDSRMICQGVRDMLIELIEERPESGRLLAGRTFARALH